MLLVFSTALVVVAGESSLNWVWYVCTFDNWSPNQWIIWSVALFLNVRGEGWLFALVVLSLLKLRKNTEIPARTSIIAEKTKVYWKGLTYWHLMLDIIRLGPIDGWLQLSDKIISVKKTFPALLQTLLTDWEGPPSPSNLRTCEFGEKLRSERHCVQEYLHIWGLDGKILVRYWRSILVKRTGKAQWWIACWCESC